MVFFLHWWVVSFLPWGLSRSSLYHWVISVVMFPYLWVSLAVPLDLPAGWSSGSTNASLYSHSVWHNHKPRNQYTVIVYTHTHYYNQHTFCLLSSWACKICSCKICSISVTSRLCCSMILLKKSDNDRKLPNRVSQWVLTFWCGPVTCSYLAGCSLSATLPHQGSSQTALTWQDLHRLVLPIPSPPPSCSQH